MKKLPWLVLFLAFSFVFPGIVCAEPEHETGGTVSAPQISAETAVLMELHTGRILYEKNCTKRAYPASTTKIMTALLALENGDPDKAVPVSASAAGTEGSSIYLEAGETVSLRDLIYGLMLRSGNDAAVAIADAIGGDTDEFVNMMNRRAEEIGTAGTHFVNPNGLYDEQHYTTALDMALIARTAMLNPAFREIAGAKNWKASRAADHYNDFVNKNKVVFQYEGGTGIKIGYTTATGRTLVASSERNGMEVICVVMQAPDWFHDSYKLMDWAYETFEIKTIAAAEQELCSCPVRDGGGVRIRIGLRTPLRVPVKRDGSEQVELCYDFPAEAKNPCVRWTPAGRVGLSVNGSEICRQKLYYLEDFG